MAVTTQILPALADSQLDNIRPDTNYGTDTSWQVGSDASKAAQIFRGVIRFPLVTANSGEIGPVIAVDLYFRQIAAALNASPCRVHTIINPGILFVESQVTWNDFDLGSSWITAGGDTEELNRINFTLNDIGTEDFNLDALNMWNTQIVDRGQLVFSVLLKRVNDFTDNATGEFASRENATVAHRPILTITRADISSQGYMAMSHAGLVVPPRPW